MNLTEKQAKLLTSKPKIFTWMEMLNVQPPEGLKFYSLENRAFFRSDDGHEFRSIPLPHKIGKVVEMRETWGKDWHATWGTPFIYKADNPNGRGNRWYSSTTMPKPAIRHHYNVTGLHVCRVRDVRNNQDIRSLLGITCPATSSWSHQQWNQWYGIDRTDDFKQWFSARYSKPRPRRKNGEIVSWECWCTERPQFLSWKNPKLSDKLYSIGLHSDITDTKGELILTELWNDLPLIININPWICLYEGEIQ